MSSESGCTVAVNAKLRALCFMACCIYSLTSFHAHCIHSTKESKMKDCLSQMTIFIL
jgi:hypothetical protein